MVTSDAEKFITVVGRIASEINQTANDHGFWSGINNHGEKIALMHSELSEALEGLRLGDPESKTIPPFSNVEEELADCIIRILDFGREYAMTIPGAIIAKMEYNKSREFKHGKEF